MSDIEIQLGHSNIGDNVLKRIRKYLGKKTKYVIKIEKEQYKCYSENLNPNIFKTKNNRLIMQWKCSDCRIEKSRFVKEQEAKGRLSNLWIKAPLSKIPLLNVLF